MDEFALLLRTIQRLFNMHCENYKEDYLKRRIASRMNARRITTYREYRDFLQKNQEEHELLKNALTINVTKFFRDPQVFECIRSEILAPMVRQQKRIRIWSAGCSSGEEPYSYAMILHDLTLLQKDVDWAIIATDIDDPELVKAREGVYESASLEHVTERQLHRHFVPTNDGRYRVKPHLKERVIFQHHDLMSGVPVARNLDLISCRNVTIYFTEAQKNDLARMFHEGLRSGGYYVMGMSEFLSREIEHLYQPFRPLLKIFQKKG